MDFVLIVIVAVVDGNWVEFFWLSSNSSGFEVHTSTIMVPNS